MKTYLKPGGTPRHVPDRKDVLFWICFLALLAAGAGLLVFLPLEYFADSVQEGGRVTTPVIFAAVMVTLIALTLVVRSFAKQRKRDDELLLQQEEEKELRRSRDMLLEREALEKLQSEIAAQKRDEF